MKSLIDKLRQDKILSHEEFVALIENLTDDVANYAFEQARQVQHENYGNSIYIRGLIEISNYCKNDCYYCGIRRGNKKAQRYRLTLDEILDCCKKGYDLGFRTFVLQGGEDRYFTDEKIVEIVSSIKSLYPDCAVTLSLGEKARDSYQLYFSAGADRYLLRHETADCEHYAKLHPSKLTLANRKQCLYDLKEIGFQVGCGFMVGSPYQTPENLAEDMLFIHELQPHMVGIGPFLPHKDTPFAAEKQGSFELTLFMLALTRLMLPKVLLPATTALGTITPSGREMGIKSGANVVMPNLSPADVRDKYMLYDNKLHTGCEAAESIECLKNDISLIGYEIVVDRGDHIERKEN